MRFDLPRKLRIANFLDLHELAAIFHLNRFWAVRQNEFSQFKRTVSSISSDSSSSCKLQFTKATQMIIDRYPHSFTILIKGDYRNSVHLAHTELFSNRCPQELGVQ